MNDAELMCVSFSFYASIAQSQNNTNYGSNKNPKYYWVISKYINKENRFNYMNYTDEEFFNMLWKQLKPIERTKLQIALKYHCISKEITIHKDTRYTSKGLLNHFRNLTITGNNYADKI